MGFAFPLRPAGIFKTRAETSRREHEPAGITFKSPALVHVQISLCYTPAGPLGPPAGRPASATKKWIQSRHPVLPNRPRRKEFPNHVSKSTILLRSRNPSTSVPLLSSYSVTPNKRNAVGIICREMSLLDSREKENRVPCVMVPTSRPSVTNILSARWRS